MPETFIPRPETLSLKQHYSYTGEDAHNLAVARTKEYLTKNQWDLVIEAIESGAPMNYLRFCLCITGVEGYPVRAMLREFHPRYVRRFGAPSKREKGLKHG